MAMIFPGMTGYFFKSDWSLLMVATIPLLALIALILISKYQSLRLEGAGFKFEVRWSRDDAGDRPNTDATY